MGRSSALVLLFWSAQFRDTILLIIFVMIMGLNGGNPLHGDFPDAPCMPVTATAEAENRQARSQIPSRFSLFYISLFT
jgi:hypothetical protein